ncbi:MAG: FHA domain-containing protein [Chloroflexaceae bacterium]|nr:FHA domain-containing protein [Chloroflexaceae bacterium]
MRQHHLFLFLSGLVFLFLLMPDMMTLAQGSETLTIVEVNNEAFPEIAVTLRYLDAQNSPVQGFKDFAVTIGEQPVTGLAEPEPVQRPIAVSLVVDLSAAMRGDGIPPKNRFKDMQTLLTNLMGKLQLPSVQVSLVVFDQEVKRYHPMTADIVGVLNTINNADPERPFVPQEKTAAGSYPLGEAILEGLRQFDQGDPAVPRLLFVFAAGTPEATVEDEALRTALAERSTEENPLTLVVLGFGGTEQTENSPPANPALLEQVAQAGNGNWLHFFTTKVEEKPSLNEEAEHLFDRSVQRADHYVLKFQADTAPAGIQPLRVRAGNAEDMKEVNINVFPPRIKVWLNSTDFQDRVQLRIITEAAQSPLTQVEYLLDNHRIATATAPPDFAHTLDVYEKPFQEKFPPGQHELVAAVTDANGQHARSAPMAVTVFAPPPPDTPIEWLSAIIDKHLGLILIVLAGVGIVVLLAVGVQFIRARKQSPALPVPGRSRTSGSFVGGGPLGINPPDFYPGDDGPTQIRDDERTDVYDADKTAEYDADKTAEYEEEAGDQRRFRVVVVQGEASLNQRRTSFDLRGGKQRNYDIGRPSQESRPEIPLDHKIVSRNHAKLVVLKDGEVQLIAVNGTNGTFVGNEKKKLENGESANLKPGDVFWISPVLQLRLEEEKP